MWPFRSKTEPELRDQVRDLKRRFEEVEYEWADWYQKFRNLHARLAKAAKAAERDAVGAGGDGDADGAPGGPDVRDPTGAAPQGGNAAPATHVYRRLRGF